jgi:D-alanyl-D-alanine carboxypeptidase
LERWLAAALDYLPRWIDYQMRLGEQPGCALAVVHRGRLVLEQAWGHADLGRGIGLTPRHRFRVASHSKSFTAAAVLRLRETGRIGLDDRIGRHIAGLHPDVGRVTIAQLLSHSAGLVRDGVDTGQWQDRRGFLDVAEVRAGLEHGTTIEPNTRFKYSNIGFALLGMAIEAVTGEPYPDWVAREIVAGSGLAETLPDAPPEAPAAFARGHSAKLPLGRRLVVPGENPTRALAAATGFLSTAADLARFYASLAPNARRSVLSVESRREMTRRLWRDTQASAERWYGLGTISGTLGDWEWFGHSGGFQGYVTRTVALPVHELAVSVLTNAADGSAHAWVDGAVHVLRGYAQHGAPSRATAGWGGRWWSLWGAVDLLPAAHRVLVANPAQTDPFLDASEIEPLPAGRRARGNGGSTAAGGPGPGRLAHGRIALATGYASHGEPSCLVRDAEGRATEFWLAGWKLLPEARVARELTGRYGRARRAEGRSAASARSRSSTS